jgi:hypothetical protein
MWDLFVTAAWKVTVAGFVFGVGLPVLFALGVRSTVLASTGSSAGGAGGGEAAAVPSSVPAGANRLIGFTCFALVLIAVVIGLLVIIAAGLGKEVSFDHLYPTVAPKG